METLTKFQVLLNYISASLLKSKEPRRMSIHNLTLLCIIFQNGQRNFKKVEANDTSYLNCILKG